MSSIGSTQTINQTIVGSQTIYITSTTTSTTSSTSTNTVTTTTATSTSTSATTDTSTSTSTSSTSSTSTTTTEITTTISIITSMNTTATSTSVSTIGSTSQQQTTFENPTTESTTSSSIITSINTTATSTAVSTIGSTSGQQTTFEYPTTESTTTISIITSINTTATSTAVSTIGSTSEQPTTFEYPTTEITTLSTSTSVSTIGSTSEQPTTFEYPTTEITTLSTSTSTSTSSTSSTSTTTATTTTETSSTTTSSATTSTSTSSTSATTSTSTSSTSATTSTSTSSTSATTSTSTSSTSATTSTSTSSTSATTSTSTSSTSATTSTSTSSTSATTSTSTSSTSSTSTTATTATSTPLGIYCANSTHVLLTNGTCVTKTEGLQSSYDILTNGTSNSSVVANNLIDYFQSIGNDSGNSTLILSPSRVDTLVRNLGNISISLNGSSSFLMVQQRNQSDDVFVLGASFMPTSFGEIINTDNINSIISSVISAAGVVSNASLVNVKSLNMFIANEPTIYKNVDNSTNNISLVSSVIVAAVQGFDSTPSSISISLYFKTLPNSPQPDNGTFLCSFYDTNTNHWNQSGCSSPQHNDVLDRYECNCNHTTSFALIWLPPSLLGSYERTLRPADIASLVCQSLSIVCFLVLMVHAIGNRVMNPLMSLQAKDLLPLISCASTTSLFIFYIALGMTVYTQTSSPNQTQCFLSSRILMFITYFFLIFMFCTKTSVGFYNYLRFVYLFPQPSFKGLFILLILSFLFSIGWVSFAAGFDSNSSYNITQLYPYRLCWFTHSVIYYFMTIPVCIFLLLNFFTIIFVGKNIIKHARNATSPHRSHERMKRCVTVLLSSCVTQGIGWLFGPFLSFASPTAGDVLEWFFIILNALEGVWAIILYKIILSQKIDEQKRVTAVTEITRSSSTKTRKSRRTSIQDERRSTSDGRTRDNDLTKRRVREESTHGFDDLNGQKKISTYD